MCKIDYGYYGEYAGAVEDAESALLAEIQRICDKLEGDGQDAPVEHVKSRVKSPSSLEAKLSRLGYASGVASGISNLSDVIGARIVTHFIGDIYKVLSEIESSGAWCVEEVKDYISKPKANGYRSLHVIVSMPFKAPDIDTIKTEIQLRTVAMDCWASLEHQLHYKKDLPGGDLVAAELKRCADEIASTDLSMQTLRNLVEEKGGCST